MGSLEKLLELKLSRWSLLSSFCPSLAWPLPRALLFPELSVVLATYRPSRHGSWPSSSTLLTHSHSWLDTEEAGGLSLFPALFPESETSPPNKLGSCNSRPTSTWFPSGQLLQEEQRGLFLSQEHLRSSPWRATQAKAEWYWAQQAHQAQLAAHNAQIAALGRKKRSNIVANLPLPGTAAVSALTPEQAAFWYQAQLQQAQNEIAVAGK